MKEYKKNVRNELLYIRKSLTPEEVRENSRLIFERVCTLSEYKNSKYIMCYVSFQNEVDTHSFIKKCLTGGKRIAVPLVEKSTKTIIASEITNFEEDLVPGTLGILEPRTDNIRPVNPEILDMVIVPGVGFDKNKNRIGFGAGYYDKFLPMLRKDCLKAAVAFSRQVLESLPVEPHDMKMDMVICENKVIG